jgi:hypothetical protein
MESIGTPARSVSMATDLAEKGGVGRGVVGRGVVGRSVVRRGVVGRGGEREGEGERKEESASYMRH